MLEKMVWRQGQLALCSSLKERLHGEPTSAFKLRMAGLKMRASAREYGSEKYLYHSGLPSITLNVGAGLNWEILLVQSWFTFAKDGALRDGRRHGQDWW